jgi:CRP/FNR family transcriptional regulator, anaerobic regulatory protein
MEKVLKFLNQLMPLNSALKQELVHRMYQKDAKKGELLIAEGKICTQLYFICKGYLRGFHYQKGKEITTWFGFENDIATSAYSFLSQKIANENVEAMEDSLLYGISFHDLTAIYQNYPEFNYIGRIFTEKYYFDLMEHSLSLQFQNAHDSYLNLLSTHPQILKRASLGHIASYIGISQETLSRIRAKIV